MKLEFIVFKIKIYFSVRYQSYIRTLSPNSKLSQSNARWHERHGTQTGF